MIKIQHDNEVYAPVVFCDACNERILDPHMALVRYVNEPEDGDSTEVLFAHKGRCDKELDARIAGQPGWEELTRFLTFLVSNVNFSPAEMITLQKNHARSGL